MKDFKKSYSFGGKRDLGAKRGPSMFGGRADRSSESHKATCDGCHAVCEVPFVPNGKKPVYCRNCYKSRATTTAFSGQPFPRTDASSNDLKKQFSILNTKLDRLTAAIEAQTRVLSSSAG